MSTSKNTYTPTVIEKKWYAHWLQQNYFRSRPNPKKAPFTVLMPPPNITGILHMGHILNNTIQDVLVRKARMEGKEACWVPGTDHASIATEAKVVAQLKAKGIEKKTLTREEFLQHVWAWRDKYGAIILNQLKKLGVSCDWERTCFTMDPALSAAVTQTFIKLHEEGYLYRAQRMIHWDPAGQTALADEEVIMKETAAHLYYIRYPLADGSGHVVVATTRPETMPGDTALCVNPTDKRYTHLHGKKALLPLLDRPLPIITDTHVAPEFGTGCLKVTPAHDFNDHALAQKHDLPYRNIFSPKGILTKEAGIAVGLDRFEARKQIVEELKAKGYLVKVEPYTQQIGFSERTHVMVEPRLSTQWFVRMQALAKAALDAVEKGDITFHPKKFNNLYRTWLSNVRDWCISRQLWWGHRIPAYYLPNGDYVVAATQEEALAKARKRTQNPKLTVADLNQDPDTLDTWFSAWLWPMSVFEGMTKPNNPDFSYYFPTHDLVTAPEIIFFWVARMIMASHKFTGKIPFRNVYFTGIVRDKQHRKMSKSLGNSPDPLVLIDQYGADGVRAGMLFSAPAGNDLLFDEKLCLQGRNFANKIWHALQLVKGWEKRQDAQATPEPQAIAWCKEVLAQAQAQVQQHFAQYRISDALILLYKLIREDFCSVYLEMVKPASQSKIHPDTYAATLGCFESLMVLLHPFMPFITEEVYQSLKVRKAGDTIVYAAWPTIPDAQKQPILDQGQHAMALITQLRHVRHQHQLPHKTLLTLYAAEAPPAWYVSFARYIEKLAHLQPLQVSTHPSAEAIQLQVSGFACLLAIPHTDTKAKEVARLQKELTRKQSFLAKVNAKLENPGFVGHAPKAVIAKETQKKVDLSTQCQVLQERLARLG